jgi:radical SAM superfamily enzyme YgiQ (UPF0313 family)
MKILQKYQIGVIVGVVVGVPRESKKSLLRTLEFLKKLSEFDNIDRIEWGSLIPFPGSQAYKMLREHPELKEKYRNFGDENYFSDLTNMIEDWYKYFCEIDFDYIQKKQEVLGRTGLVPYEVTKYQRRSWSGTPSKVFL